MSKQSQTKSKADKRFDARLKEALFTQSELSWLFQASSSTLQRAGAPRIRVGIFVRHQREQIEAWVDDISVGRKHKGLPERFLKFQDVMEMLRVKRWTLNMLMSEGDLGSVRFSSQTHRFDPREVRAYLNSQAKKASA